jgi:hypothetical protein
VQARPLGYRVGTPGRIREAADLYTGVVAWFFALVEPAASIRD